MALFISPAAVRFQLAYEISPITLTGGAMTNFPGGALPIVALTEPGIYSGGLLAEAILAPDLDLYLAHFIPLPSTTLIDNQYGEYPFANQQVAANAAIVQPLRTSLLMICPANPVVGYFERSAILANMQAQLAAHVLAGGSFTVATPAITLSNGLLLRIEDVSPVVSADAPQPQTEWRWDFYFPLVTQQQAQQAQNAQMAKITSGTQYDPSNPSSAAIGAPQTGVVSQAVPTSQPTVSSGAAGPNPGSAGTSTGLTSMFGC